MISKRLNDAESAAARAEQSLAEAVTKYRKVAAQDIYKYLRKRFRSVLKEEHEVWKNALSNEPFGEWLYRVQKVDGYGWGPSVKVQPSQK